MPRTASRPGSSDPPDSLPAGTRLGEYEVERLLHASGFSATYLVTDRARGQPLMVDEYLPAPLAGRSAAGSDIVLRQKAHAEAFERGLLAFIAESDLLARCLHPALPQVLRRWRANGTVYRAMPWAPSTSLRSLREPLAEPPDEDALRYLLDGLLGALGLLHAAGHTHGAITADTVFLRDEDDSPLLLGFDAAQRAIVGSQAQALMRAIGSGGMPGEAGEPGPAIDVHAVALVMRFCIEGPAFTAVPPAPRAGAASGATVAQSVARLTRQTPGLYYSTSFVAAIDGALASRPQDRPQTIAQFRAALMKRGRSGTAWARPPQDVPVPELPAGGAGGAAAAGLTSSLEHLRVPHSGIRLSDGRTGPSGIEGREPPELTAPLSFGEDFRAQLAGLDLGGPRDEPAGPLPFTPRQRAGVWAGSAALLAALVFAGWQIHVQWRNDRAESGLARVTEGSLPMAVRTMPAPLPRPADVSASVPAPASAREADAAALLQSDPPRAGVVAPEAAATGLPPSPPEPSLAAKPTVELPRAASPTEPAVPKPPPPAAPRDPLTACSPRTQFSLYRCMQTQCAKPQWRSHAQCVRLREDDRVG